MADATQARRVAREMFLAAFAGASPAGIEPWVVERMTGMLEDESVRPGEELFRAGEPSDYIRFMGAGRVLCTHPTDPPWSFEGHWTLGILDLMQERPHSRTATAETQVRLVKLRTTEWLDLLDESFDLKRSAVASGIESVAKLLEQALVLEGSPPPPPPSATPRELTPMNLVDRLMLLIDMPMFQGAGVQTLADIAGLMRERIVEPGEIIYERDAPRQQLAVIVEGIVESTRKNPDLHVQFSRAEIAGGPLTVGPTGAAWETMALTRTKLLAIAAEDWYDEMEEHFALARSALIALGIQREDLLNKISKLTNGATMR